MPSIRRQGLRQPLRVPRMYIKGAAVLLIAAWSPYLWTRYLMTLPPSHYLRWTEWPSFVVSFVVLVVWIIFEWRWYSRLRQIAVAGPRCWHCFYDIAHLGADSERCPECAFSVSDSIRLWSKTLRRFRPKWTQKPVASRERPNQELGSSEAP